MNSDPEDKNMMHDDEKEVEVGTTVLDQQLKQNEQIELPSDEPTKDQQPKDDVVMEVSQTNENNIRASQVAAAQDESTMDESGSTESAKKQQDPKSGAE